MPPRRQRRRSNKGALLKGMSRRLPVEILESAIFEKRIGEIMRGYAGIYALYSGEELYYIGLTTNLLGAHSLARQGSSRRQVGPLHRLSHPACPIPEGHRNPDSSTRGHARQQGQGQSTARRRHQ
jgi:hypothetical protein